MKSKWIRCWLFGAASLILAPLVACPVMAQETGSAQTNAENDDQQQIRAALEALRDRVIKSYEDRDLDAMLKEVGPDVVVTWQNSDRTIGPDEFRAFYKKMMEGEQSVVVDVSSEVELAGPATLYGDSTAVAFGTIKDTFTLRNGASFELDSKWTATVSKLDGEWKIVSYHVSSNIFDNPLLDTARSWLSSIAIIASLLGFALGAVVVWFLKRSTAKMLEEGRV